MERTTPPAVGERLDWEALDEPVRARIDAWLGSPVVYATTQQGGFSPGIAARLRTASGRRVFAKAVRGPVNSYSTDMHRREARILDALPRNAPVPRLLWQYDEGTPDGWIVLLIEDVDGWHPALPWNEHEVERLLGAMDALSDALTPSPVGADTAEAVSTWVLMTRPWWAELAADAPPGLDEWSRRNAAALAGLAARAPEAAAGDTLVHLDLRGDNMLFTADTVLFVDWAHARTGAAWNDVLWLAPSVEMQGGPRCEELLSRSAAAARATPDDVTAVLAAIAGFFTASALQPAPPGLPTLRAFQAAQGEVARRWLAERTGLA